MLKKIAEWEAEKANSNDRKKIKSLTNKISGYWGRIRKLEEKEAEKEAKE